MGEHTHTPWTAGLNGRSIIREVPDIADGCDHYMVAVASAHSLVSPDEAKANAAFIVEAVNSYDRHRATIEALVGALILARKRIEYYGASGHERHADHDAKEILPKIDSALQLARGSKGDE